MVQFPKVIGYVPVYKTESFIGQTLEALANQNYPNFEILVCDDASPDNTGKICQEFCQADPRFKFIQNTENLGWFQNSNRLWLESAKGSTYCFSNPHDDLPYPNYISELVSLMESNPGASIAVPGMENVYWDQTIHSFYLDASNILDPVERCFRIAKKDVNHWWAAYHGLYRSDYVNQVYPIKKLPFGEKEFSLDLVSILKMAFHGPVVTSTQILLRKNYIKNSVSSKWKHNSLNKTALWLLILEEIKKSPLTPKEKSELSQRLNSLLLSRVTNRFRALFK